MNKILFVVACEGNYQGLHGINDYTFIELEPDEPIDRFAAIARDIGGDLIWGLIESYNTCEDDDEESAYEDGGYYAYYFKTNYTLDQLEDFYLNDYDYDSFQDFVEKFGGKEVE